MFDVSVDVLVTGDIFIAAPSFIVNLRTQKHPFRKISMIHEIFRFFVGNGHYGIWYMYIPMIMISFRNTKLTAIWK